MDVMEGYFLALTAVPAKYSLMLETLKKYRPPIFLQLRLPARILARIVSEPHFSNAAASKVLYNFSISGICVSLAFSRPFVYGFRDTYGILWGGAGVTVHRKWAVSSLLTL